MDITGKEANTLVNTNQLPGEYNIRWNGKMLSEIVFRSGAYFIILQPGKIFLETKNGSC
ncbi:MAG: hypothetical protein IPG09_14610 [Ignavibacteria bacterium]|nr:hypothetical protein [Ignavibacteria bacterium]